MNTKDKEKYLTSRLELLGLDSLVVPSFGFFLYMTWHCGKPFPSIPGSRRVVGQPLYHFINEG
jgi:hypothetical protein